MATRKSSPRKTSTRTAGRRAEQEETRARPARGAKRSAQGKSSSDEKPRTRRARAGNGKAGAAPSNGQNGDDRARRASGAAGRSDGRRRAEQEMEKAFGFVPDFYDAVPSEVIEQAWGMQRELELNDTALDMKTKELIGLAIASHIKCRYCVYFHSEVAKAHGATAEELREAAAMGGMTDFFSNAITGAQIDFDQFKRDTDRAIEHMKKGRRPGSRASAHR